MEHENQTMEHSIPFSAGMIGAEWYEMPFSEYFVAPMDDEYDDDLDLDLEW